MNIETHATGETRAAEFVLDAVDNPHPKMLAGALSARGNRERWPNDQLVAAYWEGYLTAMADATGCAPEELQAWMDSHV